MEAHLEPLISELRIYKEGNCREKFDPYELAATVRHINPTTIEIIGVDKPVTISMWKAIHKLCTALDITVVEFDRAAGAKKGRHIIREKIVVPPKSGG